MRLYDGALSESEVKQLTAEKPTADVLVHLDAAKLDAGHLPSWENSGALGGAFVAGPNAPLVTNVNGRIAVWFEPGCEVRFIASPGTDTAQWSVLATVWKADADALDNFVEIQGEGISTALPMAAGAGRWHQLAWIAKGQGGQFYMDGHPEGDAIPGEGVGQLERIRLGSNLGAPRL